MDIRLRQHFQDLWAHYFPGAELPLAFYYCDDAGRATPPPRDGHHCLVCALEVPRHGQPTRFDAETVLCGGGKRYLGFSQSLGRNFRYFLSTGIPGEMEGERYKKTPELVDELTRHYRPFQAPGRYIVFKRWDALDALDEPVVVMFFATPDVLAGLFTLANYDQADLDGVIAPMGSGCSSIVYHPYQESLSPQPRAVLGMFDVSARPCVSANVLTLAVPWSRFGRMVDSAPESFLTTASWEKVRRRILTGASATAP